MKKCIRKIFPEQKNPFKNLLLTAALCAVLRVALVVFGFCMLPCRHLYTFIGLIILLVYPQIPDLLFLRPQLRKTFLSPSFSKEHVTWLKERQDVSPDQLRVFFRKILSFRRSASGIATGIAIFSFFIGWALYSYNAFLVGFLSPVFYLIILVIRLSLFHSECLAYWPKRYRSDRYNFSYKIRIENQNH